MHNKAYKMMEKLCEEIEAIGLDNMDMEQVEKAKAFSCIASNMAQTEYHKKILDEMKEAEYGVDYDENGELRQFSSRMHPRSSRTGRFVDRNYTEPMVHDNHMQYPVVTYREGSRHYTEDGMSNGDMRNYGNSNERMYSNEYGKHMRTYMDKKHNGENATKQMDEAMKAFKEDMMPALKVANRDEKMVAKQNLMRMAESIVAE